MWGRWEESEEPEETSGFEERCTISALRFTARMCVLFVGRFCFFVGSRFFMSSWDKRMTLIGSSKQPIGLCFKFACVCRVPCAFQTEEGDTWNDGPPAPSSLSVQIPSGCQTGFQSLEDRTGTVSRGERGRWGCRTRLLPAETNVSKVERGNFVLIFHFNGEKKKKLAALTLSYQNCAFLFTLSWSLCVRVRQWLTANLRLWNVSHVCAVYRQLSGHSKRLCPWIPTELLSFTATAVPPPTTNSYQLRVCCLVLFTN